MINENDFEPRAYAQRVMAAKGYDVEASDEFADIFELQWPGWRDLIARHRIGDELSRAEQLLTTFMQREVIGGATRILEAFAKHLDIQPKQGGSPDWATAAREMSACAYCEGRGVVSNVPCETRNKWGETVTREYSFACVCDRGRFFGGMRVATDDMLRFAVQRHHEDVKRGRGVLERLGVDPDAAIETQRAQFRQAMQRMKREVASGKAKPAAAKLTAATNRPPEKLNPERVALAVYDNGDERNEWA